MLIPVPLLAYLGPGGALSSLGSFLALLGTVVLAVVGFVWYPIKRLLRNRRAKARRESPEAGPGTGS
ncbi:MAG: hypothetical protein IPM29_26085 [Planctomycetes bacterium]|nr:hypothetical protein [Planctomycetota bacterium]